MDQTEVMKWSDVQSEETIRAMIHYFNMVLTRHSHPVVSSSAIEVNNSSKDNWLRSIVDLKSSANEGVKASLKKALENTRAPDSSFDKGALKKENAKQFLQFIILHNGGAVDFNCIQNTITTWIGATDGSRKVSIRNLRSWLSNWCTNRHIASLAKGEGKYTMTEEMAQEAIGNKTKSTSVSLINPMLKDFDLDFHFPINDRVKYTNPKA